jgi:glutamyl endopeptidase
MMQLSNDSYLIQLTAIATYKSRVPDHVSALKRGLEILHPLDLVNTNDSQTLSIAGYIELELYEEGEGQDHLAKSLHYFERSYYLFPTATNCLNLAFILAVHADSELIKSREEEIADGVYANRFWQNVLQLTEIQLKKVDQSLTVLKNRQLEKGLEDCQKEKIDILLKQAEAYYGLEDVPKFQIKVTEANKLKPEITVTTSFDHRIMKLKKIKAKKITVKEASEESMKIYEVEEVETARYGAREKYSLPVKPVQDLPKSISSQRIESEIRTSNRPTESPLSSSFPPQLMATSGSETELEIVEGQNLLNPWIGDQEVSNGKDPAEAESPAATMPEQNKSLPSEKYMELLDAFYASYPELIELYQQREWREVIIRSDNRVRINETTSYPWRAICALKITAQDNSMWIGTGWLISPRTVITAGHCVYMHNQGGWAKSIEVIPAMNDQLRPYGSGSSSALRSVSGWVQNKNRDYDYGAIILPANYRPGALTGYFGFSVKNDSYLISSVFNISGYPEDKGGNLQWLMGLKPKSISSRVINYETDKMAGQSGAPVWIKVGETRYAVGIHTNGHISGSSATRIVPPVFNNLQEWKNLGL